MAATLIITLGEKSRVTPPQGWRLLLPGEITQAGDMRLTTRWVPVETGGKVFNWRVPHARRHDHHQ